MKNPANDFVKGMLWGILIYVAVRVILHLV